MNCRKIINTREAFYFKSGIANAAIYRVVVVTYLLLQSLLGSSQIGLYPPLPAWKSLPVENWTGFEKSGERYVLQLPGKAAYQLPDSIAEKATRSARLNEEYTIDARRWYGIRFDIQLENDGSFTAYFTMSIPKQTVRHNTPDSTSASLVIQGKGWHTVVLPFSFFDYNRGQVGFLKDIKFLSVTGRYSQTAKGSIAFKNIKLIKGNPLRVDAFIRSKAAGADSAVVYDASVTNSAETVQQVSLSLRHTGWEGMKAIVVPSFVSLQPGESKSFSITVHVPSIAPEGSQEIQTLVASSSDGQAIETVNFITLRHLNGPFLVHTEQGWEEVRAKVRNYDWAKKEADEIIKKADVFEVPQVPEGNLKNASGRGAIFQAYIEQKFWPVAIAYKLTGERRYAEKLALLMLRLSAPKAYPTTLFANNADIPQEGGFWEAIARSYDLIKDAGLLSAADKAQIENSLRLYIYTLEDGLGYGGISNWSLFNLCPAAQCALVLQDMDAFNMLMDGNGGIKDHLKYGMLDDGWWYEMSLGYNLACAENVTAVGLAAKPFGIDFLNERIPVSLSQKVGLRPFEFENFEGMAFGKFGPIKNNFITPKRMWDAIIIYPDYRGIMFGMGDGHEQEIGNGVFEMAYYAYRDTAYAAVIKQGSKRDLLYGVPVLPGNTPKLYTESGYSDNAGIAVLRSQTKHRAQREQIQAAFKYGTHGSYHGHFDRISLLSLMRYGRSFYNPETSWYGYASYMYKWWVQPSMSHNMVVVDGKQQEPVESKSLLFHKGEMMQAIGAETNARWSNPPYFGGYDQLAKVKSGGIPYVVIPDNHPDPAAVTGYTEPVLQRRLMLVTDDYVVLADYLKAGKAHVFDNLLHLRGAVPDAELKLVGHQPQFDASPLSSGQFITNISTYSTANGAKITSLMQADALQGWETGGFNGYQEPGPLHIDVYNVWPQNAELRYGTYPDGIAVRKKLKYEITGDSKTLVVDSFGAWILGQGNINVNVEGIKSLQLATTTQRGNSLNTFFWANAVIVDSKGKETPLSDLNPKTENIIRAPAPNMDYKGGPVTIAGNEYKESIGAEPQNDRQPGIITVDLTGLNAIRLKAVVGGDFPVGEAAQVRKTISYRSTGNEARFLTVLEPYESKRMVKKVIAASADRLTIELSDGRTQYITIENPANANGKIKIKIVEKREGKIIRTEETI